MRFLAFIGVLAILIAIGAVVYFFGGYYSVAGTAYEPAIVKWTLAQIRSASVSRHATDTPSIPLDDAAVMAGARAYAARGCVYCHGAPGVNWEKFSEGLRPDPPNLKYVAKDRSPAQLFWVIKNGINMTGMPSFALAAVPDQEIWMIAAFVKKLPDVSDADYKAWSTAAAPGPSSMPAPTPSPTPPPALPPIEAIPGPPPTTPAPGPSPAPDDAPPRPN